MKGLIIALILLVVLSLILGAQSRKIRIERFRPIPVVPPKIEPPFFGASIYEACQQTPEKMRAFLQRLKDAGGNATEIFLVHSHDGNTLQPYLWNGDKWIKEA